MQDLEDTRGVKMAFVDNEFGQGAAGAFSFNVMAAVAQYYSDNLRQEVLKGKDEKVRQGWLPCGAPYGYINSPDKNEPIQPHPQKAKTVIHIFDLFQLGTFTFESLAARLHSEGHIYHATMPKFHRTALSYILNNRFYIGEINWHNQRFPGKHRPLIARETFDTCQDILHGRNRRTCDADHPYAGGLFACAYCNSLVTGERIHRKLRHGGVNLHIYYRCANNRPNHPTVRWRVADLENAVLRDLEAMKFRSPETAEWFRTALSRALSDEASERRRLTVAAEKRKAELAAQEKRLLSLYLCGDIDEGTYRNKSTELRGHAEEAKQPLQQCGDIEPARGDLALAAFDFTQHAAEVWKGSKIQIKRRILEALSLNRTLSDTTLCLQKRKPFSFLTERLSIQPNRGGEI